MSKKIRETRQRNAISEVFKANPFSIFSPADILQHVEKKVSGIGIATVYRNLATMVSNGDIHSIMIGKTAHYYVTRGEFTNIKIDKKIGLHWSEEQDPNSFSIPSMLIEVLK